MLKTIGPGVSSSSITTSSQRGLSSTSNISSRSGSTPGETTSVSKNYINNKDSNYMIESPSSSPISSPTTSPYHSPKNFQKKNSFNINSNNQNNAINSLTSTISQSTIIKNFLHFEAFPIGYQINSERQLNNIIEEIIQDLSNDEDWLIRMRGLEKFQAISLGNAYDINQSINLIKRLSDLVSLISY